MRLIDADELCDDVDNYEFTEHSDYSNVRDMIDYAPTIDTEPVRHGHWTSLNVLIGCSVCMNTLNRDAIEKSAVYENGLPNYCPHCGAKMDGEE